jgi:hypothetical protein
MANLDLVAVRPAVSNLVPSRFGVVPVRGADTGVHQGGGSCWYGRGWEAGHADLCDGELDVGDGFGECGIGGDQVFDGGIILYSRICQIVKGIHHLLCLFEFGGLICTKHYIAGSHAIDITHLGKGGSPMGLPVGPSVVNDRNVMLLHARACLVPVVIMVSLEMGTLTLAAKT